MILGSSKSTSLCKGHWHLKGAKLKGWETISASLPSGQFPDPLSGKSRSLTERGYKGGKGGEEGFFIRPLSIIYE